MTVWQHIGNVQKFNVAPRAPGAEPTKWYRISDLPANSDFAFGSLEAASPQSPVIAEGRRSAQHPVQRLWSRLVWFSRRVWKAAKQLVHPALRPHYSTSRSGFDTQSYGRSSSSISVGGVDNRNVERLPDGSQGSSGGNGGEA